MAELVVELRSEEIPARMQARAAEDLKRLMEQGLEKAGLSFDSVVCFATPRRLALMAFNLPERQPDVEEEKRGPREGAPEQAIQGFLKSNGLESLEQAELRDTGKGNFWFAVKKIEGRATREVLPEILESAIRALPWPKSMRWGEGEFRWVRPLRSILAVFEGKALAGGLDLGGGLRLDYGEEARGHPFMGDKPFKVASFEDYNRGLGEGYVILLPGVRRELIKKLAQEAAEERGLKLKEDEALLDEVTGLAEWPQVVVGRIEPEFMELPPEVLTTSMRSHQKYFALETPEGELAPYFLVVTDIESLGETQRRKNIIAGNERVLRARLSDARFFWDQDRKSSLQSRVSDLKQVVFHAKLGTVEDKVDRVTSLAVGLAKQIEGADVDRVRSAARLAKADLTSGMVGEFPELQGIMGRCYAKADGEHADVAEAIAEHYSPLGPNDACPSAPTSVAVALADKLDTLAGFWAIDEKPTGSKDPYALRRAALGVIRLVVENKLRIRLIEVFGASLKTFDAPLKDANIQVDLLAFIVDRLKVTLRDQGVRHDLITAVFWQGGSGDLVLLLERVEALQKFVEGEAGANLLTAYRRAANIVRIEEKKDGKHFAEEPDAALFDAPEEKALAEALKTAQAQAQQAIKAEDFAAAMDALAALRGPVDAFFDKVTVNAEDASLRANRLRLLNAIKATLEGVADFSKIEG
jgi:glycyl-tRNA synthetase beta chain